MSLTVRQNIFRDDPTTFTVVKCDDHSMSMQHLQPLLLDAALQDGVLGVSATYGKNCRLSSIAFSTLSRVFLVNMTTSTGHLSRSAKKRIARCKSLIQDHLLLSSRFRKYTFWMDKLAVALHLDLSIRIDDAVDMVSVSPTDGRQYLQALMNALGGEAKLEKENVISLFFNSSTSPSATTRDVALQAWAACKAATLPHMSSRFSSLPRINTKAFAKEHLDALARISRHADRLDALKPEVVKNDVQDKFNMKKDAINLTCDRFATRIKRSKNQVIQIEIRGEDITSRVHGRTRRVDGRSAQISINQPVLGDKIISVKTIGRDDPTSAESTRQDIILKTLQCKTNIVTNSFFRALWLPNERPMWPESKGQRHAPPVCFTPKLNSSQNAAVRRILSDRDDDRVVMIQGPPGTGKTTVIAASVISHDHAKSSQKIWIAAQSNVAVKNIAEKLVKEGFHEFRLLVSKDFHFDWHEHLYENLERCVIRSDNFKDTVLEANRQLLGCRVILCTLSMFSHPQIGVYVRVVPVEMIMLDEASQIECGNYVPILHRFQLSLSKLVFIGDDKQLPPFGREDIPELQSVFEFSHLRRQAVSLDTQYRMPPVIGNFISRNVYDSELKTCYSGSSPRACLFIDVTQGREEKMSHSWINREEARVVVKLAQLYAPKRFRIITPYDAQRSLIEKSLKSHKLAWEDKVFNVDSFQGNEDEYIIISVVRSKKPGFLVNERRTNVMLTRCKKRMVICSSRAFLFGEASGTLVGKLAASIGEKNWINGNQL